MTKPPRRAPTTPTRPLPTASLAHASGGASPMATCSVDWVLEEVVLENKHKG